MEPLFYVSPDLERGLGVEQLLPNWHLVCTTASPLLELVRQAGGQVFCLQEIDPTFADLSTTSLLKHPAVQDYFAQQARRTTPRLLVFKIEPAIERLATEHHWSILNSSSELNHRFEYKVSQYKEFPLFRDYFPPTETGLLGDFSFDDVQENLGEKIVVQYDRGHTGSGTLTISAKDDFKRLQDKFPKRPVRISTWLAGQPWTVNACATRWGTLVGGLSSQLTGIPGCTTRPNGTVGNDWSRGQELSEKVRTTIIELTERVGQQMFTTGFRGLFGLDLMVNQDQVSLIEVNARQTASVSTHNRLTWQRQLPPLLAWHLWEWLTPAAASPEALGPQLTLPSTGLLAYRSQYNQQALVTPPACQLFIRNTSGQSVQLSDQFTSGVYTIGPKNVVTFVRSGYNINDLRSDSEVVLWSTVGQRLLEPEQEIARLQARSSLTTVQQRLTPTGQIYLDYLMKYVKQL